MWTEKHRPKYNRDYLSYPSDLTDEEGSLLEPIIPPARRGGRRRAVDMREVLNGLMYVLSTGRRWRYIPKDLPPKSTVYRYFCDWRYDGTLDRIHYALYIRRRAKAEREASPTACIVDSRSVKSAEKGGRGSILTALMAASSSRAKRGISLRTRTGCCSTAR